MALEDRNLFSLGRGINREVLKIIIKLNKRSKF